jgi:FkbM family methyltransferase
MPYLKPNNGFFIEAGANDGLKQSNTHYLEKRRGWSGLLIEPIPELAARCKESRKKSVVVETVLVPFERSGSSVEMLDLDLMTMVIGDDGSSLDQDEHRRTAEAIQRITGKLILINGIALSELIEIHGNPHIDFFSLDVEGYELDVLNGLDLSRHRPSFILVETKDKDKVVEKLDDYYKLIAQPSHHDFLFGLK